MTIPQIKISNEYYKFADAKLPFKAVLVQCFKIHYRDLSKCFIAYDTTYDEGEYPLPKTDLIVLLLMFEDKKLFTTIRSFNPEKWKYYKSLEGEEVELLRT
jgi:hypothetical protein